MTEIIVPANKRLVWYLALEEYLAQNIEEEQLFFWTVDPTVIFGRHQVMANEVNIAYCQEHGIQMYRRKSGGGCVYSDRGNLMTSYVSPSTHSEQVFQLYLDRLAQTLTQMGFEAAKTEHNDVLVGDRKVSGNACYALPTGTIVHGTLLWDVNFAALQEAITPSREKLAKHGVQSVRQRVVNLKALTTDPANLQINKFTHLHMDTISDLQQALASILCDRHIALDASALAAVDEIEKTYLDPTFLND